MTEDLSDETVAKFAVFNCLMKQQGNTCLNMCLNMCLNCLNRSTEHSFTFTVELINNCDSTLDTVCYQWYIYINWRTSTWKRWNIRSIHKVTQRDKRCWLELHCPSIRTWGHCTKCASVWPTSYGFREQSKWDCQVRYTFIKVNVPESGHSSLGKFYDARTEKSQTFPVRCRCIHLY